MRSLGSNSPSRGLRKDSRRFAAAALTVILLGAVGHRLSRGQDGGSQNDAAPPAQNEPPVQNDADELRGREQRVLRQIIYRGRQAQTTLDQADASFRSGDRIRALQSLQQVLDQRTDYFVWVEREQRLASARHQALSLLASADSKTRELYEWAYGNEARQLLEKAKASGDLSAVGEVARRFFHTPAGFEATDCLATRWLDRGEYALAAKAWRRLDADGRHHGRMSESIRRKAEIASTMCDRGRFEAQGQTEVRTADLTTVEAGGERVGDSWEPNIRPVSARVDVLRPIFPADNKRPSQASIPYLKPAWRMPLAPEGAAAAIDRAVRHWEIQQQRDDKRAIAVNSAIVAGPAVAFRTYDGIYAVEGATGRALWKYTAGTSFTRASSAEADRVNSSGSDGSASRDHALESMLSSYAGNSILGNLSTDGIRIFAVDSMDIRPRHSVLAVDELSGGRMGWDERMARNANRLVALDLFASQGAHEGSVKPAWSIGGSMGTSNWFYRMDANDDGRVTQAEFLGSSDEFRAIDRNGDGAIDKAEADRADIKVAMHPLHGHFFLGPPLALDGRLYAITESDCQLNLVALSADTGAVQWSQGIGYVDRPIDEDPLRYALACTPCYSAGVIVCPTQMGILVGVDALDGALLWTYYYGDEDVAGSDSNWSFVAHRLYGNPGFHSAPVIDGNRIVIRPSQSEWIHCIDLKNGRGIWKRPRDDAEFIAATSDGIALVVGDRVCRGLSLKDGAERWSARLGEVSGRGLRVGTDYLLPLANNRIVAIDIRNGSRCGCTAPLENDEDQGDSTVEARRDATKDGPSGEGTDRSEPVLANSRISREAWPENLVGGGAYLYSIGAREIVAYPRAEALLDEVKQRFIGGAGDADSLLTAAELELTLGHTAASRSYVAQAAGASLSAAMRKKAERLTRAVLYQELACHPPGSSVILAELAELARTPRQRGRFLQARMAEDVRAGNLDAIIESSHAFAALELPDLVPSPLDSTHLISTQSWLNSSEDQIRRSFAAAEMARLQERVKAEQRAALESGNRARLEQFLAVYRSGPAADEVRLRLARMLVDAGELQRAELLLAQNQRSARPETVSAAAVELARIWHRAGLCEEAASLVLDLERASAEPGDSCSARPSVRSLLDEFGPDSMTRLAYARLKEAEKPVSRVRVTQSFWQHCDNDLAEIHINASRLFVTRPASPVQLIDHGSSMHSEISVLDSLSGTSFGTLHVPAPYSGSSLAIASQVGHFLPLGSQAALHGISLLQRDRETPFWTLSPLSIVNDGEHALVGPTGPTFAVFQSHRHLFVVDPGTGKLLWQRTDIDPQAGLAGDPVRGIFGDDEVIVVLAPDHLSYTVYRTGSGDEIRQGRFDSDAHHTHERRAFGRFLLHFTSREPNRRMRIWDPLEDRLLYDRPIAAEKALWKETGEDEVAVLVDDNTLEIVDCRSGVVRASVKLDAREVQTISQLAVYRDQDRYYLNLQPLQSSSEPRRYSYCFGTDTVLPRFDLRGTVIAVDRKTGHPLWRRAFPPRTIVRTDSLRLPVLIMLSLVGDRINGNQRSMLVEVVDAQTGETLGLEDNNFNNKIFQLTFDENRHRVRLWGSRSVLDLDFVPRGAAMTSEAAP